MFNKYISCLLAISFTGIISAQNITKARNLFLNEEYNKAESIFQKLLKKAPSNTNYNYWYGVCLLKNGKFKNSLPYIEKGAKGRITNAYKYLAEAYFYTYHFDQAEDYYSKYISALEKDKKNDDNSEATFDKIKMASRMIKGVENITIVDSFIVNKKNFLSTYKISEECGKISYNSDNRGITYTTENENNKILSMPNDNGKLQLNSSIKLIDGWSKPTPINSINGDFDINYPYLMSDGITLYYSANGRNSLGGYDIFVTRYDSDDRKYLRSENIGMPFNSPFNDYMFVVDEINNLGWFASDRYQPEDNVCIYVFVPNKVKFTYDYENTTYADISKAASLRPISYSQRNQTIISSAKERLQNIMSKNTENNISHKNFTIIIDDMLIYHSLNDFKSVKAKELYQQYIQKEKDFKSLQNQITEKRESYMVADKEKKFSLSPSILDMEKRVEEIQKQIKLLILKIRNEEISILKK